MLNDATCFKQFYIVCGYTDLRSGIDKLASIIDAKTESSPYVPDTLYLFCVRKTYRIKGLVWEKDGFLLLYKRLEHGKLSARWKHLSMWHDICAKRRIFPTPING